ncbi:MAG TPA: sensor histidine kinase [Chitinophaga sp.]|uniref:sensor histidine kinase n=1 Tax=Chitinophaga sp. TaxID=1869181 RepID=UPI002BC5C71D|nr:sensor histidine kinase [Chitinophaga sp.]HVI46057.1 sensor histidine kinase [Chitinophaga sp.]
MRNPLYAVLLLLLCSFISFSSIYAQNDKRRRIDSLEKLLAEKKTDTGRAWVLGLLAQAYSGRDSVKAFNMAYESLDIYRKRNHPLGLAFANYSLGECFLDVGNFPQAQSHFELADSLIRNDTSVMGRYIHIRAIGNLANVMAQLRKPKAELELLIGLVPDIERTKDSGALGVVVANIASELLNTNNPQKAYAYLKKAETIFSNTNLKESLAFVYINLVECMQQLDSIREMRYYLDKSYTILLESKNSDLWPEYYLHEGLYAHVTRHYNDAVRYYLQAEDIALKYKRGYALNSIWEGLSETYISLRDYKDARKYLLQFFHKAGTENVPLNELKALKLLTTVEEQSGNIKAAHNYLRRYEFLSDSIKKDEIAIAVEDLQSRYQNVVKEKEILALQNRNKQQQLELQQGRYLNYLLLTGLALLLGILMVVYLLLRHRKRLHRFEVEKIQQEHRISLLHAMVEGQEQERNRLARDLHDGLGGILSGTKLELSGAALMVSGHKGEEIVRRCMRWLDQASEELRRIARSLMPEILMNFGLERAFTAYCDTLRETGLHITCYVVNYKNKMDITRQMVLYRIMQELVNNAMRHAAATEILVELQETDDKLFLTVEDDGKGFDKVQLGNRKGTGLLNIQSRVEFLNGEMDIISAPGKGTTIIVECLIR